MSNIGDLLTPQIPRLRRYARSLTRDRSRAEDLLQSCLVRALEKEHLWQPGTDLRAWLFTIVHNQHVNDIRRSVREGSPMPIEAVNANLRAGPTVDACLELSAAEQAIASLPRDQREVIIRASEGQHYQEMARALGVPIGTVRSRLLRGRIRARELMGMADAETPPSRRWAQAQLRRAA